MQPAILAASSNAAQEEDNHRRRIASIEGDEVLLFTKKDPLSTRVIIAKIIGCGFEGEQLIKRHQKFDNEGIVLGGIIGAMFGFVLGVMLEGDITITLQVVITTLGGMMLIALAMGYWAGGDEPVEDFIIESTKHGTRVCITTHDEDGIRIYSKIILSDLAEALEAYNIQ